MVKFAAESKIMNPSVQSSRDLISSLNILYAYKKAHLQDQKVSTHTVSLSRNNASPLWKTNNNDALYGGSPFK